MAGAVGAVLLAMAAYRQMVAARLPSDLGPGQGDPALSLAIKWEGLWVDHNFRDAGESLNNCLGRNVFATDRVLRANVWFSGWSCDQVGRPDVIYSLNFAPERHEQYFCTTPSTLLVGRHFNSEKMNDLEFTKTWQQTAMRDGVCGFFRDMAQELGAKKKVLIHCDAGKDRTGTAIALLYGLALESKGQLDAPALAAIECDYRRSKKLEVEKYGRMATFLTELRGRPDGILGFLKDQCQMDPLALSALGKSLLADDLKP